MEMQPIEIPEFEILRGEKAIEALYVFINELEGQRGKELTDKQTNALIKLAKELISSIETETQLDISSEETDLLRHLKETTIKCISDVRTRFGSVFAR
jgi:hypothetical protein